jgi:Flp pilus assembly protein TadD
MRGLGRLEMAERTLSTALREDPKQPRALYEMGKLEAQRGDKARALQDFQALQAADAKWARAHHVDEEIARLR